MTFEGTPRQERALALLQAGQITVTEVAGLLRTSRQLVWHWCRRRGIDAPAARKHYLQELWKERVP
jgi:hypothetical protein